MNRKYVLTILLLLLALAFSPMANSLSGQAREFVSKPAMTTITIWYEGESPTVLEEIAAGFIVMHPDISINLENKSDLFNKFIAAASSGGGPDLVLGPQD